MNFQSLANELILDIFEYFPSPELLLLFHGLNNRFNNLLYLYLENFPLDFRSISKGNFDYICHDILPLISDKIISIHLSNDDDTPNQPNLFFSYGLSFQQFIHLQSLSLYYLHSIRFLNRILVDCPQLISLNISQCDFSENNEDANICINQIWSLTKLRYCYLNEFLLPLLTTNSLSIQQLSTESSFLSSDCLISIFQHTPNLQSLNTKLQANESFSLIRPLLTKLKLYFRGEFDTLKSLLMNLPNLSKLILRTDNLCIDGYQWEDIITNYLVKLKIFRLSMYYQSDDVENFFDQMDQLFESFQTKFWIDEHQWFIQYDQNTEDQSFYLYTLPYRFRKFSTYSTDLSKSTCTVDKNLNRSHYVQTLFLNHFLSRSTLQFTNIHHLELEFPFNDLLWSIIPKFDRLKTLEAIYVTHSDDNDQSIIRLRSLLKQAIYFHSLTIDYLILSQLSSVSIENKFLRRLDLISNDGHFYGQECISFIQSLLNNQCETLLINIENRSIILDLIRNLSNLRALTFQSQDDQWGDSHESLLNEDELLQWLKTHLPSNSLIIRDEREMSVIHLWIR